MDDFQGLLGMMSPGEDDRRAAIQQGLLATGLGLLGSRNPRFAGALGEAGMQGIGAYQQHMAIAPQQRIQQLQVAFQLAKMAEEQKRKRALQQMMAGLPEDQRMVAEMAPDEFAKAKAGAMFPKPGEVSALGKLMAERAALPPGDPRAADYDEAIRKATTHAPAAQMINYGSPVPVELAGGGVGYAQPTTKGDEPPRLLSDPRTGEPLRKPQDPQAREYEDKKARMVQAQSMQAKSVLDTVREAKGLVGYTTAGVGGITANIPMTQGRDLSAKLQTIKANLGFDRLQQMREASPTGGALGQVAVQELQALQSTVASLDQMQSPQQLRNALGKIEQHYANWLRTIEAKPTGAFAGDLDAVEREIKRSLMPKEERDAALDALRRQRAGQTTGGVRFLGFE